MLCGSWFGLSLQHVLSRSCLHGQHRMSGTCFGAVVEVVVHGTEWYWRSVSIDALTVGIAHEKMALPITWTASPHRFSLGASTVN